MEPVPEDIRLLRGAYWRAKLRWIAVVCVPVGTYVSSNILDIALAAAALYTIAILLFVYNVAVRVLLDHAARTDDQVSPKTIRRIIHLQISADLILLTVLLHFSGGIENPLVFFFIFHMVIASSLLSPSERKFPKPSSFTMISSCSAVTMNSTEFAVLFITMTIT